MREIIDVGILHESVIFARGLTLTLQQEDPILRVNLPSAPATQGGIGSFDVGLDVLVCSESLVPLTEIDTRIIVITNTERRPIEFESRTDVVASLCASRVSTTILVDTVRAVGAGIELARPRRDDTFSSRGLQVISGLSSGETTRDISLRLGYSERTIKKEIADMQKTLGARNRCQLVALALRTGLI